MGVRSGELGDGGDLAGDSGEETVEFVLELVVSVEEGDRRSSSGGE